MKTVEQAKEIAHNIADKISNPMYIDWSAWKRLPNAVKAFFGELFQFKRIIWSMMGVYTIFWERIRSKEFSSSWNLNTHGGHPSAIKRQGAFALTFEILLHLFIGLWASLFFPVLSGVRKFFDELSVHSEIDSEQREKLLEKSSADILFANRIGEKDDQSAFLESISIVKGAHPFQLLFLLFPKATAFTIDRTIYWKHDAVNNARVLKHELTHALQYYDFGIDKEVIKRRGGVVSCLSLNLASFLSNFIFLSNRDAELAFQGLAIEKEALKREHIVEQQQKYRKVANMDKFKHHKSVPQSDAHVKPTVHANYHKFQ